MIVNACTCTGPYAILIMLGIKRVENRSVMPVPKQGRCAISCSKSFCKEEYGNFIQWTSVSLSKESFNLIPSWSDVEDWAGKIVGACDYLAVSRNDLKLDSNETSTFANECSKWDEGYPYWWKLSNVVCFDIPIPCRGNVGMWQMGKELSLQASSADSIAHTVGVQIKTADDAAKVFRNALPIVGKREGVFVLPLDDKGYSITAPVLVSLGTGSDTATVQIKDVYCEALRNGASSIIVAHNHPMGTMMASEEDWSITEELIKGGRLIGIPLIDHIILDSSEGGSGFASMRNNQIDGLWRTMTWE